MPKMEATMRQKNKTAGKTAKRCATRRIKITLVIDSERYDTLDRIARALNSVSWCDGGNTPKTVFDAFLRPFAEEPLDDPSELCGIILSGIATGDDGMNAPEPVHGERLAELSEAFTKAGL